MEISHVTNSRSMVKMTSSAGAGTESLCEALRSSWDSSDCMERVVVVDSNWEDRFGGESESVRDEKLKGCDTRGRSGFFQRQSGNLKSASQVPRHSKHKLHVAIDNIFNMRGEDVKKGKIKRVLSALKFCKSIPWFFMWSKHRWQLFILWIRINFPFLIPFTTSPKCCKYLLWEWRNLERRGRPVKTSSSAPRRIPSERSDISFTLNPIPRSW